MNIRLNDDLKEKGFNEAVKKSIQSTQQDQEEEYKNSRQDSEAGQGQKSGKSKILNCVYEVRSLFKTEEERETIMTIITDENQTYTSKVKEKSKKNIEKSSTYTYQTDPKEGAPKPER